MEIGTNSANSAVQARAAVQLCGVYQVLAEQRLDNVDPEAIAAAGDLYEKCVACARLAKDEKLAGINCFRLGKVAEVCW